MENKNNKAEIICFDGIVTEALPSALFEIILDNGKKVLGHTSGRIRKSKLRILVGDKVSVELSIYDLKNEKIKCRITRRLKNNE